MELGVVFHGHFHILMRWHWWAISGDYWWGQLTPSSGPWWPCLAPLPLVLDLWCICIIFLHKKISPSTSGTTWISKQNTTIVLIILSLLVQCWWSILVFSDHQHLPSFLGVACLLLINLSILHYDITNVLLDHHFTSLKSTRAQALH
jgi:hypothetical protein